jgi:hypothetical protein
MLRSAEFARRRPLSEEAFRILGKPDDYREVPSIPTPPAGRPAPIDGLWVDSGMRFALFVNRTKRAGDARFESPRHLASDLPKVGEDWV